MLDPNFKLELALIEELVGERSERRLRDIILDKMPSASKATSPREVATSLQVLQSTESFKLATRAAQEKVRAALALVSALAEDRTPDLQAASECSFLSDTVAAFQFFPTFRPAKGDAIRGVAAFAPLIEAATHKSAAKTCSLADIAPLRVYSWLCPAHLDDPRLKAIADVEVAMASTFRPPASSGRARRAKNKASGAQEAAMAMFA